MNETAMASFPMAEFDNDDSWPADGLEAVPCCPVCGTAERELLYEGLTDRVFFCAPGKWTLHRCKSCRSGYLDPRPTPKTIGLAYRNYFTHEQNPDFGSLGFKGKLRRALANGYRNWRFGTRDAPSNPLGIVLAALSPKHRAVLDAGMRHLPKPKPGQRLLDVGCGNGTFLMRARSAGWDVVGVDFDPKAVEVGRRQGLDVRLGGVDTLDPEIEQFDVITLSHVIEHVHHPVDVLRTCHALLKRWGNIWIETPNLEAAGHRKFGDSWRGLEPPRHLVLFTYESLANALHQIGFEKLETMPYRDECSYMYCASEAVRRYINPYQVDFENKILDEHLENDIKIANNNAHKDNLFREFLTIKTYK